MDSSLYLNLVFISFQQDLTLSSNPAIPSSIFVQTPFPYASMNTVYFQVCQDNTDYVRDKPEGNFYQPEATLKQSEPQSFLFKYIKFPLSFSQCDHQFSARIYINTHTRTHIYTQLCVYTYMQISLYIYIYNSLDIYNSQNQYSSPQNVFSLKICFISFSNEETLGCVHQKVCLYQKKVTKISILYLKLDSLLKAENMCNSARVHHRHSTQQACSQTWRRSVHSQGKSYQVLMCPNCQVSFPSSGNQC